MFNSLLAISAGASAGAISRWLLGLALNALFPPIPLGTLAANLVGGYFIGLCMSFFAFCPTIAPEWRLFALTGFLGALTTFSAFSAEVATLLQQGRFALAAGAAALHLFGSLAMTFLGIASFALVRHIWH
ncbi:MAG: fluoride efflux transporter CrcB [Deltaproteobacteria bacterium]|nr:fluoride efflux transporter CrcB [Deltaproteobacteria bacterium]